MNTLISALALIVTLVCSGIPQSPPPSIMDPGLTASCSEVHCETIRQGYVIVRTQAHFRYRGSLVIITGGIPHRGFRTHAEYDQYIQDGVQHHRPGASRVNYNTDAHGNAVVIEMAVTDRTFSTTTFRPAPTRPN